MFWESSIVPGIDRNIIQSTDMSMLTNSCKCNGQSPHGDNISHSSSTCILQHAFSTTDAIIQTGPDRHHTTDSKRPRHDDRTHTQSIYISMVIGSYHQSSIGPSVLEDTHQYTLSCTELSCAFSASKSVELRLSSSSWSCGSSPSASALTPLPIPLSLAHRSKSSTVGLL